MREESAQILEERNERHQQSLKECCKLLGLQDDVKIIHTKGFRWMLEYDQSPNHPDFGRNMIKLERMLQLMEKRPIDLRLEPLEDKNKRKQRNVLWKNPPASPQT
jgi:hypothetical protein